MKSVPSLATIRHALEGLPELRELPGSRKGVLAVLAIAALPREECWPSQATIQERSNFSVRTVRRSLRDLEAAVGLQTIHGQRYELNVYDLKTVLSRAEELARLEQKIRESEGKLCPLGRPRKCRARHQAIDLPNCEQNRRWCRAGACGGPRVWRAGRCELDPPPDAFVVTELETGCGTAAGLRVGDVMVACEGLALRTPDESSLYLRTLGKLSKRTRTYTLTVLRAGQPIDLRVQVSRYGGHLGATVNTVSKIRAVTVTAKGSNSSGRPKISGRPEEESHWYFLKAQREKEALRSRIAIPRPPDD